MLRSGDQIGPYTLINKLGKGAFGVVWLAERRTQITTTTAAIKIPLDEDISIESVKNEADLWVRASGHPNVLPIIEANIYDEQIIIASEYAPDGSLDAFLKNYGKSPTIESAVEILAGILTGLEHLHSRNIIHRDLKPANILFQGNTPRLADFGISRVFKSTSQSSNIMGTPSYMAPEAFDGKRNEQTDIWSVGVIFYQLLAGHLPYREADITSLVGAILMRNPEPLPREVPQNLQNVIARALAKDKNIRYKSATEMRLALRNPQETDPNFQPARSMFTVQSPINTMPPQPVHSQPEKRNNTPHLIYAIAGLLAVIILVSGMIFLFKSSATNDFSSPNKATNNSLPTTSTETPKTTVKQPTPKQPLSKTVTLQSQEMWMDTGINVNRGDNFVITASGSWSNSKGQPTLFVGPNGMGNSWKGIILESSTIGSLIGKIGNQIFPIGESYSGSSSDTGILYLSMNDVPMHFDDNVGSLTVNITVSELEQKSVSDVQPEKRESTITVLGTDNWRNTKIEVQKGQRINISASGSVIWDADLPAVNPDGTFSASTVESPSDFPLSQAGCGSLVMRIGNNKYAVGSDSIITAQNNGTIQFIVNDRTQSLGNNSGSFTVRIKLL